MIRTQIRSENLVQSNGCSCNLLPFLCFLFCSFSSLLCSVAVFAQSVIGAGLLAFPSAYRDAGYGYIGIIQSILLVMALGGLRVIARCAILYDAPSYDVMVRRAAGKIWGVLCEVVMLVLLFGACVAYLAVVTDQLQSLFENIMATQARTCTNEWMFKIVNSLNEYLALQLP